MELLRRGVVVDIAVVAVVGVVVVNAGIIVAHV